MINSQNSKNDDIADDFFHYLCYINDATKIKRNMNNVVRKNIIKIYVQNLSGAASKIMSINHRLATSTYDLICVQETWFTDVTDTSPLIANVDYQLYRCDRSGE